MHPIEKQLKEIRLFKAFPEEHRPQITDPKIFVAEGQDANPGRRRG